MYTYTYVYNSSVIVFLPHGSVHNPSLASPGADLLFHLGQGLGVQADAQQLQHARDRGEDVPAERGRNRGPKKVECSL